MYLFILVKIYKIVSFWLKLECVKFIFWGWDCFVLNSLMKFGFNFLWKYKYCIFYECIYIEFKRVIKIWIIMCNKWILFILVICYMCVVIFLYISSLNWVFIFIKIFVGSRVFVIFLIFFLVCVDIYKLIFIEIIYVLWLCVFKCWG